MNTARALPRTFDALIKTIKTDHTLPILPKTDQTLPVLVKTDERSPGPDKTDETSTTGAEPATAIAPGDDIVSVGEISIREIEKLIEQLGGARDYLKSEGERVRRINARYAHLTRTASASVKIITESMGKWRTTETEGIHRAVPEDASEPSVTP